MHVAPAVVEFVRRYPKVEVELLLLDRIVDLVDEGIDAAIRIARLADSSMIAIPVGAVRRVVCASPKLLRAEGEPARRRLPSRPVPTGSASAYFSPTRSSRRSARGSSASC
jgi:DNA-binding transcriptional LysR family regulator